MATDLEIVEASLDDPTHTTAIVRLLDAYAREPMGIGRSLSDDVKANLIPGLRAQPNTLIFLAFIGREPAGVIVCFRGFSTFAARPVLNVHDLAVRPGFRGRRIGLALLRRVEERGLAMGCIKVTLEVREDNESALKLYRRAGFAGDEPQESRPRTLFLEKELPPTP
ncbi:MAG: GNAT family N-acetyltransferase [Deltaproteobacteria bacterium]|nr:GNAT family N-acetyltransferase [Deltaproteobacteria bacterium]